jgi:hypothetical protein
MGLIDKLFDTGKSATMKIIIAGVTLFSSLLMAGGCGHTGGDDKDKEPEPPNQRPGVTIVDYPTTGTETVEHKVIFDVYDNENDPVTVNLTNVPTGSSPTLTQVDTYRYEITLTPDDNQSGTAAFPTNFYTIEVSDGLDHDDDLDVDSDDSTFETGNCIFFSNTETSFGNVSALGSGTNLETITLYFDHATNGTYIADTDSSGNWSIAQGGTYYHDTGSGPVLVTNGEGMLDGDYDVMIKDENTDGTNAGIRYETYTPRPFRVNKTKAGEGKLEKDCRLHEKSDLGFVNDIARANGMVLKWAPGCFPPTINRYGKERQSTLDVSAATLSDVDTYIEDTTPYDGLSWFLDTTLTVNPINTVAPIGQPADGTVKVLWDDATSAGINTCYLNASNEIVSATVIFNTSVGRNVHMQELSEPFLGSRSGFEVETIDPTYSTSVFYGTSANTVYSDDDAVIRQMIFVDEYKRPAGNRDAGSADYHDNDGPVAGVWNE